MEKDVILWLLSAFIVLGVPAGDRVKTKGADASLNFSNPTKMYPQ